MQMTFLDFVNDLKKDSVKKENKISDSIKLLLPVSKTEKVKYIPFDSKHQITM